ncbi:MAG: YggT family protein [Gemmatimonadales bacterium]
MEYGLAGVADLVARSLALALAAFAGVTALTHWGVRNGKLPPFGAWSKTVRALSDPFLRPIEKSLVRRGGNPQDASLWLLGAAVLVGLALVTVIRWLVAIAYSVAGLATATPGMWARMIVGWAFGLVIAAIFVRFIASWLRISPYERWMRPVIWLTEWILAPVRRVMPPIGILDFSPMVAYLILLLLRGFVFRVFFGT